MAQVKTYDRKIFFDGIRNNPFNGLTEGQVEGMEAMLDYIDFLRWWPRDEDTVYFLYWTTYLFATTFHETAKKMQPIKEYGSQSYLQGKKYYPYYGRGLVQLTWDTNYKRSDDESNADDLVPPEVVNTLPDKRVNQLTHLDQALILEIALSNLCNGCHRGWYGGKLWTYLQNTKKDYVGARYCVNVQDKANTIAGYARTFETALRNAWIGEGLDAEPEPDPEPEEVPDKLVTVTLREGVAMELSLALNEALSS